MLFSTETIEALMVQNNVWRAQCHRRLDDNDQPVFQVTLMAPGHQAVGEASTLAKAFEAAYQVYLDQRTKLERTDPHAPR